MATDGSLIFNTKIDTDGIVKGEKDISSKLIAIKSKMAQAQHQAKRLREELEATGNAKVKTKVTEKLESDIARAQNSLNRLDWEADRFIEKKRADFGIRADDDKTLEYLLNQDKAWQKLQEQISKAEQELTRYKQQLQQAEASAPFEKDTAAYRQKQEQLEQLELEFSKYSAQLREQEAAERSEGNAVKSAAAQHTDYKQRLKSVIAALKSFYNGLKRVGSALKSAFSKTVGSAISRIGSHFHKTNHSANVLEKSLRRIKNTLVRMFFMRLVHSPIDAIKEGLGEIAKVNPSVNKSMSALKTSSDYLKNSFAALAAPLVQLVTPAFVKFFDAIADGCNSLARLISLLTGNTAYTQAVKTQKNYAASLDDTTKSTEKNTKATEENQRSLAGYDQLNVMSGNEQDNQSNQTAQTAQPYQNTVLQPTAVEGSLLDAFKNLEFGKLGEYVADRLNKALSKIKWDKIKNTVKKWATNIADFLNGFIRKTNWDLVGKTIGEGINTAIDFANTFLSTFNWFKFGESISSLINSSVKTINWENVGLLLSNGANAIIRSLYGFVITLDWSRIGAAFHTAIRTAIANIDWRMAIDTLAAGINGLIDFAIALVGNPDFEQLGRNVAEGLMSLLRKIKWNDISHLFSTLFIGALQFVDGFVLQINWKDLGKRIKDGFNKAFGENGEGRKVLAAAGKTISDIADSVLDLWIAFFEDKKTADNLSKSIGTFFKNIPWKKLLTKAITGGVDMVTWVFNLAIDLVDEFCKGLATGFENSENDSELNKAVMNLGISIANALISVFEGALRLLCNAIPNFLLGALKSVLFLFSQVGRLFLGEDWFNQAVNSMDSWKINIPVNIPRIPKLATGTVIPASYGEFLAVLGDNKREPEVVSPISSMKQALKEALAESSMTSGEKEINLYMDGELFFRWLIGKNDSFAKSHGYSAFAKGARS